MNTNHADITAVSVGGLIGIGKFIHDVEPLLADLSYLSRYRSNRHDLL
jgi:hypothetical protein